jgi:predicted nucleotidyltransferase
MSQVKETLQRLLANASGLELAYLFGSHARGTARPDSDVDVAVRFQGAMTAVQKMSLIESIANELGCVVDIVDLYDVPEPITGEALQGLRLVGTDEAHARLVTRHLLNVADFLPLRKRMLDERRSAWIR